MRAGLVALLLLASCANVDPTGGDDADDPAETAGDGLDGLDVKADGPGGTMPGTLRSFELDAAAFPGSGHPDVVVYLPQHFDATPPIDIVVFLHGWSNCARNVVGSLDTSCTPGAGRRRSYALAAQLEASGKNAILVVPELAYDRASGDPGRLADPGQLQALVDETLGKLAPDLGDLTADDLGRVVVASHSGGYHAAAAIVSGGGLPVDELYLLDSLYGLDDAFDGWIDGDHELFASAPPVHRFATVYTQGGGTLAESQAMAARAAGWFAAATAAVHDDRTTSTWTAPAYAHGLLFKRTGLTHDGVPRYYFGRLLLTSGLADSPR